MLTICDSSEPNSSPCFPAVATCKIVKCDGGPAMMFPQSTREQVDCVCELREILFVCGPSLSNATSSMCCDDTLACVLSHKTTYYCVLKTMWPSDP